MRNDHTPAGFGGFAHAGSTKEGPHFSQAPARGGSAPGGIGREGEDAFNNADRMETTKHEAVGQVSIGQSAGVAGNQEPKDFANSGTTKRGPTEAKCATDVDRAGWGGTGTRPRIRMAHSGFKNVPQTSNSGDASASRPGHYGLPLSASQAKGPGGYAAAGIGGKPSGTARMATRASVAPKPPGREGPDAFRQNAAGMTPKRPGR